MVNAVIEKCWEFYGNTVKVLFMGSDKASPFQLGNVVCISFFKFLLFRLQDVACGILILHPGITHASPILEHRANHWIPEKSLICIFKNEFWHYYMGFLGSSDGRESVCKTRDPTSVPGWGRSPGEGKWLPTPVFLPGVFHGQRSLAGYM